MMRSATAFLPDSMITFMNLERSTEPNFGSGRMSRLGTSRRRGIALPFASVDSGGRPNLEGPPDPSLTSLDGLQAVCPVSAAALRLLRALGAVFRTRLLAILHALQVERAAHDVIANARQILDAATAHEHEDRKSVV